MIKLLITFVLFTILSISCKKDNTPVSTTCKEARCIHNTHWGVRCKRNTTYCNQRCHKHQ